MKKAVLRCGCGCGKPVPEGRTTYASKNCAQNARWRRWRARRKQEAETFAATIVPTINLEAHTCGVCFKTLVRAAGERRRLYHEHCKPLARKILRVEQQLELEQLEQLEDDA